MTHEYVLSRDFGDAIHTDPDTYNVDHVGEPQKFAARLADSLPGLPFLSHCDGGSLHVLFERELEEQEHTAMVTALAEHKAIVDWPPPSEE